MNKVLIAFIVTAMGLEASKTVVPNKDTIDFHKEYLCSIDGDNSGEKYPMLFAGTTMILGTTSLTWIGGDYDIFKTKDKDGYVITTKIRKDGKVLLDGKDFNVELSCKVK